MAECRQATKRLVARLRAGGRVVIPRPRGDVAPGVAALARLLRARGRMGAIPPHVARPPAMVAGMDVPAPVPPSAPPPAADSGVRPPPVRSGQGGGTPGRPVAPAARMPAMRPGSGIMGGKGPRGPAANGPGGMPRPTGRLANVPASPAAAISRLAPAIRGPVRMAAYPSPPAWPALRRDGAGSPGRARNDATPPLPPVPAAAAPPVGLPAGGRMPRRVAFPVPGAQGAGGRMALPPRHVTGTDMGRQGKDDGAARIPPLPAMTGRLAMPRRSAASLPGMALSDRASPGMAPPDMASGSVQVRHLPPYRAVPAATRPPAALPAAHAMPRARDTLRAFRPQRATARGMAGRPPFISPQPPGGGHAAPAAPQAGGAGNGPVVQVTIPLTLDRHVLGQAMARIDTSRALHEHRATGTAPDTLRHAQLPGRSIGA